MEWSPWSQTAWALLCSFHLRITVFRGGWEGAARAMKGTWDTLEKLVPHLQAEHLHGDL